MDGLDLGVVDSVFGGRNGAAPPPAAAAPDTDDVLPEDAQPIEPVARTRTAEPADPDVQDPPADEAQAARAVANRLKVPQYMDLTKLQPEQRAIVENYLQNMQAQKREVDEKERKAGDVLEHADLVKFIRDDPEANQLVREVLERRRQSAAQQAAGQPAQPAPYLGGLSDVREEFQGLAEDQLAVIERLEQRNGVRQEAMARQVRDTVVALLQHVVGPIKKQQADAEASRQWSGFTSTVPDWNRHVSPEALKQRQGSAPHVPVTEHFFAAAGPKLYAENQQLKKQMAALLAGNRPTPPRVAPSRRASVEPVGDPSDWGSFFDAVWKDVGGGA